MVAGADRTRVKGFRRNKALRSCQITRHDSGRLTRNPEVGQCPVTLTHDAYPLECRQRIARSRCGEAGRGAAGRRLDLPRTS